MEGLSKKRTMNKHVFANMPSASRSKFPLIAITRELLAPPPPDTALSTSLRARAPRPDSDVKNAYRFLGSIAFDRRKLQIIGERDAGAATEGTDMGDGGRVLSVAFDVQDSVGGVAAAQDRWAGNEAIAPVKPDAVIFRVELGAQLRSDGIGGVAETVLDKKFAAARKENAGSQSGRVILADEPSAQPRAG